jgi:hypothetical protein
MRSRLTLLQQLIEDSIYVVDTRAVAEAILARASVRARVGGPAFRSQLGYTFARSFRRQRGVRSFRLASSQSHRRLHYY